MNGIEQDPGTPMEVLKQALKREQAAFRYYDSLLQRHRAGIVRDVLEKLREEEAKHVRMVEKKIAELQAG